MRRNHTKIDKINTRKELKIIFSSASKQISCKGAKLRYMANGLPYNRMMICLVRKFGNAVQRNRTKRIFREIYRNHKDEILIGYDLVFILLPGEYETKERSEQFTYLIKKAKLLHSPE